MLQIERLQKIQEILEELDVIGIPELEKRLDTSKATIYRDIKMLQKQGKLQFVRGGIAKSPMHVTSELPYYEKRASNTDEKKRIAREAAEYIHPNSTIFLDSSTTVVEMVKHIRPEMNLKIITNDLVVGSELAFLPGIEVHVIGGMIRRGYFTLTGLFAQNNLKGLRIDAAFLGSDAISLANGCMLTNSEEVSIKQQVMAASSECYLLADHSKFNSSAFISFCMLDEIGQVITGRELPDGIYNEYIAADINLLRV